MITAIAAALFFYGDFTLFMLTYITTFIFLSFRAVQSAGRKRSRFFLVVTYIIVLFLQVIFYTIIMYEERVLSRVFSILAFLLPIIVGHFVAGRNKERNLPRFQETVTISFAQIHALGNDISRAINKFKKNGKNLSYKNFKYIIEDMPRHNTFRYVNTESLTADYFNAAEEKLDDPHLYVVISNTGAPSSEFISTFTQKQFNHASLAFDAELQTIVSYNDGQRVYPPGLNYEAVSYFNRKHDASILVYSLKVTHEQKRAAIDLVAKINREGSAYNLLGLLFGRSYKSNIMYCSQFVYFILEHIGASYFHVSGVVKPTDFIEKDYLRKLSFVEEIKLNES
ncbi:MAG: hypothetical protein FWF94_08620 [Oscillospiraceae bacterium]|nr:hypothetical protein [Oscillospiraceae bacterium]